MGKVAQLQGLWFNPELWVLCVQSFACSTRGRVVHWLPPTFQKHKGNLVQPILCTKLSTCTCVCVGTMRLGTIQLNQGSKHRLLTRNMNKENSRKKAKTCRIAVTVTQREAAKITSHRNCHSNWRHVNLLQFHEVHRPEWQIFLSIIMESRVTRSDLIAEVLTGLCLSWTNWQGKMKRSENAAGADPHRSVRLPPLPHPPLRRHLHLTPLLTVTRHAAAAAPVAVVSLYSYVIEQTCFYVQYIVEKLNYKGHNFGG